MIFVDHSPQEVVAEALVAANAAGAEWMAKATPKYAVIDSFTGRTEGSMLDLCGNAHLQFRDKRSKIYKAFLKADLVRQSGNAVVELDHKYQYRQEHGLQMACVRAAKIIFEKHGITDVRIWDYID